MRTCPYRSLIYGVVGYVAGVHLTWAFLLWLNADAANATGIHILLTTVHGTYALIGVLLVTSGLALWGLRARLPTAMVFMMPQQVLLLLSASSGIGSTIAGQFADGVPRPWEFIAADKLDLLGLALLHAVAVILTGTDSAKL